MVAVSTTRYHCLRLQFLVQTHCTPHALERYGTMQPNIQNGIAIVRVGTSPWKNSIQPLLEAIRVSRISCPLSRRQQPSVSSSPSPGGGNGDSNGVNGNGNTQNDGNTYVYNNSKSAASGSGLDRLVWGLKLMLQLHALFALLYIWMWV